MAFKVLDEDVLVQLEKDLVDYGVEVEQVPAEELKDCGRRVRFTVPSGHAFELYADKLYTGKWGLSDVNPEAWPRGLWGMKAQRFDHCLFYGPDLAATYDIFAKVLGFDLVEQVLDPEGTRMAQFLTASMKEHDVAFIHHEEKGKFHHASFLLETWEGVLRAADLISMTDTSIDIGPTRHGLTHGTTIYFFDPSGNRNEVFCGGDYFYPDHKPVTWEIEQIGKAVFYHDRALNERFMTALT
ncbi:MAG: VOC family protein, partial [Pseudomonadota bacterium]|nr:VOC family protein [Pseudomonadota bacterium]